MFDFDGSCFGGISRRFHLVAQQLPDPGAQVNEGFEVHHFIHRHAGPVVRTPGWSDIDDFPNPARTCRHHHDAVGEIHRLFDAMGDEENRAGIGPGQPDQFLLHQDSGLGVERAERLVHQQHVGIDCIGARNGHPLLQAARQLMGIGIGVILEAHQLQEMLDAANSFAASDLPAFEAEADVLAHGLPGKQRELLKHHGAIRAGCKDRALSHEHAAGGREVEPGGHAQHRRLAAAGWADNGHELPVVNRQGHIVDSRHGVAGMGIHARHRVK